ncbi:NAD(P)H-hydrate dehydratase [Mesonia aestuariivivens]|uniref:Bifunctional NAD(P)H-hydrate repair enzyme n=1 Tax=Mesonia aestuariivivens TaxID=2796128 RepID=A0ABS6VYQ2_9FLAO|nr:NAD(P)H-hydrate dehydratase [Mesonia aestuariivivens]MBW2960711.1 NAD(P)H-hydrate dehydratase [Mesonia aestuariivivens]
MKIFNKEKLKETDEFTIKEQNIKSDELMERAAIQLFGWLKTQLQENQPKINLFCGIGNNGGDGLALARLLLNDGYDVEVYIVNFSDKRSDDFLLNLKRLKENDFWPEFINSTSDLPKLNTGEIVIDAIFGIGLNRPADAWVKELIQHINNSKNYVVSVDVPSGLYLDQSPKDKKAIIKADTTVTFQVPKLVFFLPETAEFAGRVEIADIGLDQNFISKSSAEAILIQQQEAKRFYQPRSKFSHKGTFGHCIIAGGSYGKIGSVLLATKAALRVGAGKVSALIPKCGYNILQLGAPEAMVITTENENFLETTEIDFQPESICFGIGAGNKKATKNYLQELLQQRSAPLLIDADGINILAEHKDLLKLLPEKSILTPHPGELKRLLGDWEDDFDKLQKAKNFSSTYQVILVIKGAYTITIAEKHMYVNSTGNPGMATAGSGDTLSGIIAGLVAQGYDSAIAAVFGVYLHGKAGDLAAEKIGFEALIAEDIIQHLGKAFKSLFN